MMRSKHSDWSFVYVPQCDSRKAPLRYDPAKGTPDFIAPMLYYSNYNSYPSMDISLERRGSEAKHCLRATQEAGWPAARTILTYQSFDAYRTRNSSELLYTMGRLLGDHTVSVTVYPGEPAFELHGPYAGVLGWPAQCGFKFYPAADRENLQKVLKGARDSKVIR